MEKLQDLTALLAHEVEDLLSAEDQIIAALPMMIETAKNAGLKKALRTHLRETQTQRKRLDKVQKLMGGANKGGAEGNGIFSKIFGGLTRHECKGMKGIIEEGNKVMSANMVDAVKDAAIIASAQKVEHYEICGYGTARSYARELNLDAVAKLLEETLEEEYATDRLLTGMAEGDINLKAEGTKKSSVGVKNTGAISSNRNGSSNNANGTAGSALQSGTKTMIKKAAPKAAAKKSAGGRKK